MSFNSDEFIEVDANENEDELDNELLD